MNNNKQKILMIDDDISIMNLLSIFLSKYGHELKPYTDPISAIEELHNNDYDILIINYVMSPVKGDKVVELVRSFNKEIYIIMLSTNKQLIPSMDTFNNLDIQAFYEKNLNFDQLVLGIQSATKYNKQLKKIKDMSKQIDDSLMEFANILLQTVDAKDNYTGLHCRRVATYCLRLGVKLNLTTEELSILNLAAMFHDIGKIGIPDSILNKDCKLTDEEYDIIKTHSTIGANILSVSPALAEISKIVQCHHERVDGKGYPNKLTADEIPKLSKILSICDCFDAITTKRSYKDGFTIDDTVNELKNSAGTQLDKEYTYKFIELINEDKNNFLILSI